MARTPDQWVAHLGAKLAQQQTRLATLRGYTTGDAPLPESSSVTRDRWLAFQKKARTNWGGLIIDAKGNRIVYNGVTVGGSTTTPAARAAIRIARDNRLSVAFDDAVRDCMMVGRGVIVVGNDDGRARVTRERPELIAVERDLIQPWRVVAALKAWHDAPAKLDRAYLWLPGVRHEYERTPGLGSAAVEVHDVTIVIGGTWEHVGSVVYDGPIPVFELSNIDDLSELEPHLDLIDRINQGVLWRLVAASIQAFIQRALAVKEGGEPLAKTDANGNPIDWARIFEAAPGALWELPEGIEIWESKTVDIGPMLLGVRDDIKELCAVTETPASVMLPDSANQSAQGALEATGGLVARCRRLIGRITPALEGVFLAALAVEGFDDPDTIEVRFEDPARITLAEKMDAAVKAQAAGMGWASIQRDILGRSEEQIAADAAERASEASPIGALAAAFGRQSAPPAAE